MGRKKVVVIGAGGHARSVIDILMENEEYEVVGCLDPIYSPQKEIMCMNGVPVVGTDEDMGKFLKLGYDYIFVAIGNPNIRKKLYEKSIEIGYTPINVISQYARVSRYAKIGMGNCIMAGAVVNVNCRIGNGCIINTNASVDHDCQLGDYVHVAPGVAISGSSQLGDGVHIGTNAAVIDGITIGAWSYVGAGAAVVGDIPEHKMVYGVPARVIRDYN